MKIVIDKFERIGSSPLKKIGELNFSSNEEIIQIFDSNTMREYIILKRELKKALEIL